MHGVVDPSVLAALPPSVQLDLLVQVSISLYLIMVGWPCNFILAHVNANILLVQMRERLMAENRQKYQRVKKVGSEMVQCASVI